jgi:diguanylate cyclase (GGDEF)-like protein/PAS domain S-box-containing protein
MQMPLLKEAASRSARAQWAWLALALSILAVAIASYLYIEHGRAASREQDRLTALARMVTENTEHQLVSANLTLESVRADWLYWKAAGRRAGIRHLQAMTTVMMGVRTLDVTNADGTILVSSRPELIGKQLAYREHFQTIKLHPDADTLYISPPFKTPLGVFAMDITRVMVGAHGEFAGTVSATLDPEYFKVLMMSVQYAPDMWVSVAHGDGLLFLMMPGRRSVEGMNIAQPGSFFTRHRESGKVAEVLTGTVYATKEVRMMALHTIHPSHLKMDRPLVVAVSRDLDTVFRPWRNNAMVQAGLFGLIVFVSVSGLSIHRRRQSRLERQAAEARALVNRFSLALDRIPTYIYMKDQQRRYVYANRVTLELFGCSAEELRGSVDSRFFPPETVARLHDIDTRVLERGEDTAETVVSHDENGVRRVYWEIKTPIYEDEKKTRIWGLCGVSTDVTEREMLKEQLERQAREDHLTGLANRRYFMEHGHTELVRAQRYGEALSLLMIDVDHFKAINDSRGHKAGDSVLRRLSGIMRETLREIDIIGRIGGEEFAVMLPETGLHEAAEIAERLRENVARAEVVLEAGLPLRITISVGVATLQEKCTNLDILLNQADKALYQAKEGGRNRVYIA